MAGHASSVISLEDKYVRDRGRVLISGRQALVRLPMLQRERDVARGLNTAGFISGYRGSPLGGYDSELWKARALLEQHNIVFQPGVNEELAATAVWGTQQLDFLQNRTVDGVFAIWYGKGPGVDRAGDALKHANFAGTARHGGALVVFGDDHAGKSSSLAHQTDLALAAHEIPVLYPSSVAEILHYGLLGFALSRYCGLLVGLKIVNETADATEIVELESNRHFVEPPMPTPPGGIGIRKEFLAMQSQDSRMVNSRLPRARAFARANQLDQPVFGSRQPQFVIVTAGKSYRDVMHALAMLEIDETRAQQIGLGIYKVGMIYPLEPEGLREICMSASEVLVVEEKRAHLETQVAALLFNDRNSHVRLSGKTDPLGVPLVPSDASLDRIVIARAISRRLIAIVPGFASSDNELPSRLDFIQARLDRSATTVAGTLLRRPTFCAGCPHNTSTVVPTGSIGMTGIGCHAMAMFMPERNALPVSHMGGEGAAWLGMAPFTKTRHVFQNLGDGTYNHSGSLAIRAAIQSRANITYKILFNDAVAMTGGQPVEGGLTVERIAAQMVAEGVVRIAVVSEQPERFGGTSALPPTVGLYHRDRLDAIQNELKETPGVTVLIFDQTCAAEKRRRRKRGRYPDPPRRMFINHLVCEGCGDCSVQSNCTAIQPMETDLGRKRSIDQSACNKDYSCTKGFCPSFVTVDGSLKHSVKSTSDLSLELIPEPDLPSLGHGTSILIAGIGGTGVVTVAAVLVMAAHLHGLGATAYDMTGLSQKGGAVFSHVRLLPTTDACLPVKLGSGEADVVVACDLIAATQADALETLDAKRSKVVANCDVIAPADFVSNPDISLAADQFLSKLASASDGREPLRVPAKLLADRLLGDSIGINMIMLGFAWQRGLIPLPRAVIERAIELNGVAVQFNLQAFRIGRAAATGLLSIEGTNEDGLEQPTASLDAFVERRVRDLAAYWNVRYAAAYASLVDKVRQRERKIRLETEELGWAVARSAFKLMAYKDEYEVARLYTDGRFARALSEQFEQGYRLCFHFAPSMLSRSSGARHRPRKIRFGSWILPVLRSLARLKFLRETSFDPFSRTSERRLERALRDRYLLAVEKICAELSQSNYGASVALAAAPLAVRGFGIVKEPSAKSCLARLDQFLTQPCSATTTATTTTAIDVHGDEP